MRPFRFGVSASGVASRSALVEKARRAEGLGYDVFLTADHLAPEVFPPLVPLVTVAEATTMRVGTLVVNNDFRHPVVLAREAAAVDLLTDGRLELGLGAGHMRWEYEQAGIGWDEGGVRVDRLTEAVSIIKPLLAGEEVTSTGRHYNVAGHTAHPRPVQQPRPPLLIGGNGRRVLTLAAREADIVGLVGFRHGRKGVELSHFDAAGADDRLAVVQEAAGDRFARLELNALVQAVITTEDRPSAAARLQREMPGLSVDQLLTSPFVLIGTVEQMAEDLVARREHFGISYFTVFEAAMEALGPVIARVR